MNLIVTILEQGLIYGILDVYKRQGPDGVTSILGLTGAIPILLGDNIGSTITALLASVGQPRDAKRTAVAHCVFNPVSYTHLDVYKRQSEHRDFLVIRFFKYRWKRSNNCIICQVCNAVYFT